MEEKNNYLIYIVAIVAIVGIVSLVLLVNNKKSAQSSIVDLQGQEVVGGDFAGAAISIVDNVGGGQTPMTTVPSCGTNRCAPISKELQCCCRVSKK